MQVGNSHAASLNSILAASFAGADIAAAAAFHANRPGPPPPPPANGQIDTSIRNTHQTARAMHAPIPTIGDGEQAPQQRQAQQDRQPRLGDFLRPRLNMSPTAEAEVFGSEDMLNDNLNNDLAQRRGRFSRSKLLDVLGTMQKGSNGVREIHVAPVYDFELKADGELYAMPFDDATPPPSGNPVYFDIESKMSESIQSRASYLYSFNHMLVDSQNATLDFTS